MHKNGKGEVLFVLCAVIKSTDSFSSAKEKEKEKFKAVIYLHIFRSCG
jgi:hypothetical protein